MSVVRGHCAQGLLGGEEQELEQPEGKADGVLDQRGDRAVSGGRSWAGLGIITTDSPWEEWPCPKESREWGRGTPSVGKWHEGPVT